MPGISQSPLIVYGSGGHGRDVQSIYGGVLADDQHYHPDTWAPVGSRFVVAVGDGRLREAMAAKAIQARHQLVGCGSEVPGVVVMPGAQISTSEVMGRGCLIHFNTIIPHDCILSDWCSLMPGVVCTGRVHIGKYAYIGAGAVLVCRSNSQPLVIGEGATVGAGAVVLKDVAPGAVVVGNPAREINK